MKKQILIMIGILFLLGVTIAGDSLLNTSKDVIMNKQSLEVIKNKVGVTSLNVKVSSISCDDKQCWAKVYYPNVIQTEWRIEKSYCSKWNYGNEREPLSTYCKTYTDYTLNELELMRDSFVKERLESYGNSLINENKQITPVVGEGIINFIEDK